MRIYEYRCAVCNTEHEAVNKIDERRTHAPYCCGKQTQIEIRSVPSVFVDNMEEYLCPVTRQSVTTRRQRNNIMAEHCLIDANDHLTTWEQRQAKVEKVQRQREESKRGVPKEILDHMSQVVHEEERKIT